MTVELADSEVIRDGDLAAVLGLSRIRGVKKDGGPQANWNRRTVVLQREGERGGSCTSSYPLMIDGSGKAAIDLNPRETSA